MNSIKTLSRLAFFTPLLLVSCGDDDAPAAENEEEVIDLVTLTFTPTGGTPIVVTATDPDGDGAADLSPDGSIDLLVDTEYQLSIKVENTIADEDITVEIAKEDDEHLFLFSFTEGTFSDPAGDGNIDERSDDINYNDEDENGFDLGLSTTWTTSSTTTSSGSFRVVLKHQPDIKSATSTSSDGESDIDITWAINVSN